MQAGHGASIGGGDGKEEGDGISRRGKMTMMMC
jgi:hypothetical protein